MRLSEAITTGRVLGMETSSYTYCGCALSIGLRGAGKDKDLLGILDERSPYYSKASDQWHLAELREWPWLVEVKDVPSWVRQNYCNVIRPQAYLIISDMFTMVTHGTATLDQLIDWVRSVEPAEPAEVHAAEPAVAEAVVRA